MSKYVSLIFIIVGAWWWSHIYEGESKLDKANRMCDPIYWVGKFSNKEITSGFTTSESQAYTYSQGIASNLGKSCFYLSSRLFKAVAPNYTYEETQYFNKNELRYRLSSESGIKSK